ncbi:MAG: GntR family transcriptional regulator [Clostridia bacterium]|nr:GntR family transcriptional regulator [Clostridia bacterium]
MSVEFDDYRPIFLQLAEMLEDAILSGVYREEDQVPSITEYSVAYKINPATALKGINLLVDAGLLYKKRGVGMFVSLGAREKLLRIRREKFYESRLLPVVREAKALGLSHAELEEMMKRGIDDGN